MRLAHVLGESGSTRARAGLLGELARDHGELRSDLPGSEGVTLGELARAASPEPPSAPPEPTFDARARLRSAIEGSFRPLCTIPTARAELPAVQVFVTDTELVGFGPDSPETPLWRTPIVRGEVGSRQRERTVVVPGRVILTGGDRFFAVDAADGHIPWERSLDGASVQEISESQGVLVVSMLQKSPWSETPRFEAVAVGLDARGGHELWRLTVATELAGGRVFADGGRLFVLSGRTSGRIELRDLYTSRLISETEIEPLTEPSLPEAFVAGGRLILPRFQSGMWPDQNHVLGLELDSLQTAWRIDIGDGKRDGSELQMVLTHADDVYLVVRGERRGSIAASGAIYQLSPRIGAISSRPIATLERGDEILGASNQRRLRLDSPYVFVLARTSREDRTALRCIHLPHGQRWVSDLPYVLEEYTSRMSPAVSSTTVALTWRVARRGEERDSRWHTDLLLLDRASGASRDKRTLPDRLDQVEVTLTPFADALYVCGNKEMETLR
jgi:outer membrane protein assembly factor BamB